jgi:phage-related holin
LEVASANERCVVLQCAIHKNLHFKNSLTRFVQRLIIMAPAVAFGSCLSERALRCIAVRHPQEPAIHSLAVFYSLIMAPAVSDILKVITSRWSCVLLQCTIHKNLHFKNSLPRFVQQLIIMAPAVAFSNRSL